MAKKPTRRNTYTFQLIVWSNIRRYQYIQKMTDEQLCESLGVSNRTLYVYDKDPSNLTLEKVDNFIERTGIGIEALIIS